MRREVLALGVSGLALAAGVLVTRPGLFTADQSQTDNASLFVLAGQSNMVGATDAIEARLRQQVPGARVVPCAVNGTTLLEWSPNLDPTTLYGACVQKVRSTSGKVVALFFWQGESDAATPGGDLDAGRPLVPATWADQFATLVQAMRADLGAPNLPVVFAQLATTTQTSAFPNWDLVQAQQASVNLPGVSMIATEDLPLADGLHVTSDGYEVSADRFVTGYRQLFQP